MEGLFFGGVAFAGGGEGLFGGEELVAEVLNLEAAFGIAFAGGGEGFLEGGVVGLEGVGAFLEEGVEALEALEFAGGVFGLGPGGGLEGGEVAAELLKLGALFVEEGVAFAEGELEIEVAAFDFEEALGIGEGFFFGVEVEAFEMAGGVFGCGRGGGGSGFGGAEFGEFALEIFDAEFDDIGVEGGVFVADRFEEGEGFAVEGGGGGLVALRGLVVAVHDGEDGAGEAVVQGGRIEGCGVLRGVLGGKEEAEDEETGKEKEGV